MEKTLTKTVADERRQNTVALEKDWRKGRIPGFCQHQAVSFPVAPRNLVSAFALSKVSSTTTSPAPARPHESSLMSAFMMLRASRVAAFEHYEPLPATKATPGLVSAKRFPCMRLLLSQKSNAAKVPSAGILYCTNLKSPAGVPQLFRSVFFCGMKSDIL